jgi:hypothetical protein
MLLNGLDFRTVSSEALPARQLILTFGGLEMTAYFWIVCGLAAFDVVIVAKFFLFLRSQAVLNRKVRVITAISLSGFIFHAFLFFEGAFLYLQLATLAVIYMALTLCPSKRQSTDSFRGRT